MKKTAVTIKNQIRHFYTNYSNEKELQANLEKHLGEKFKLKREVSLDKSNIIDFLIENVGVEVKINGSAREVYRQLSRYAKFDEIDELLLITTKTFNLPRKINGKKLEIYNLSRNSLISKKDQKITSFSEGKYGSIEVKDNNYIINLVPHVAIKFKRMFDFVRNSEVSPFSIEITPERSHDIAWFMERYPLDINSESQKSVKKSKNKFIKKRNECESIIHKRPAKLLEFKNGKQAREYQQVFVDLVSKVKRILCGDDLGLGKTIEGLAYIVQNNTLPAIVCLPTHLPTQWKEEIEEFTNCSVSILDKGQVKNEDLKADIIITKYSLLAKHCDHLASIEAPTLIFDEIHEIRNDGTEKYNAAKALADLSESVIGFSATPLFNYANDIYNIMNIINEGCLGTWGEFLTEWCTGYDGKKYLLKDGAALRSYLKEQNIYMRRTKEEVGLELPKCNPLLYYVDVDKKQIQEHEKLLKDLSKKVFTAETGFEAMRAAGDLDMRARELAGVAKAKSVANFARDIIAKGEPVIIGAWHRAVHDILKEELKEFNPVFYTGTETTKQKQESVKKFKSGESKVIIFSLKSGAGVDGLQNICRNLIVAEFAWSPSVLEQLIGRIYRPGQKYVSNVYYMMVEFASDPLLVDLLGIKKNQSESFKRGFSVANADEEVKKRGVSLAESILGKKMNKTPRKKHEKRI